MTMLAILVILVGAVLGLRFKVLILLPATAIGLAAVLTVGIARADSPVHIVLAAVLAMIGLQVGYLAGVVTRYLMVLARAPRRRTAWQQPGRSLTGSTR